jgi:hypothetical protein
MLNEMGQSSRFESRQGFGRKESFYWLGYMKREFFLPFTLLKLPQNAGTKLPFFVDCPGDGRQ